MQGNSSELPEKLAPCALCGNAHFLSAGEALSFDPPHEAVRLVKCTQCDLVRTDPLRSDEELSSLYETAYYTSGQKKFSGPAEHMVRCFIGRLARRLLKDTRTDEALPLRVLEPGCGRGLLLKAFQRMGCECTGLERPDFPAETIGEGIAFIKGDVYSMPFPDNSFDVVVLWYILEHVSKPGEAIEDACRVLKEGGTLLVAVPNINSRQARLFGKYWFHLDVPRHTHHFSIETLSIALEGAGLKLEEHGGVAMEQSLFGFVQSTFNACVPIRKMNRLFFKLKRTKDARDLLELACWSVLAALLIPVALVEFFLSLRAGRSALLKIVAKK